MQYRQIKVAAIELRGLLQRSSGTETGLLIFKSTQYSWSELGTQVFYGFKRGDDCELSLTDSNLIILLFCTRNLKILEHMFLWCSSSSSIYVIGRKKGCLIASIRTAIRIILETGIFYDMVHQSIQK